jgi:hypothetical protein
VLYYQKRNEVFAAAVSTHDGFRVTATRKLPFTVSSLIQDIHPDGRLLVTDPVGVQAEEDGNVPRRLVVATNWFTELRARLGGGE